MELSLFCKNERSQFRVQTEVASCGILPSVVRKTIKFFSCVFEEQKEGQSMYLENKIMERVKRKGIHKN